LSKLLLHACCGPCTAYVNQWLAENGFEVKGFFYNPNIRPQAEYERRLLTMEHYAAAVGLEVIYEKEPANKLRGSFSETETFSLACRQAGLRFPIEPGDCENCYRVRLRRTAQKAKDLGFDLFSTTLLISPYQKHDLLKQMGEEIGLETGVAFYYHDFRPGFRQGQAIAKEMGLYRQKYCGCTPNYKAQNPKITAQNKS
jgi:predicted adenine nucleotide alpha hydrolase (AANH) superfamily ATPase